MVSIAQAHKRAGHLSPTTDERVRLVNAGIRRVHGVAPRQVRPVVTEDLRRMVATCGDDPAGVRDRALLLLGFAAALRRSELVGLDATDVEETHDGLVITVAGPRRTRRVLDEGLACRMDRTPPPARCVRGELG